MTDPLGALLDGRVPATVYRWPAARPQRAGAWAAACGWRTFALSGARLHDGDSFLAACTDAFELPDWFGRNWDALWDCLTDLSWARADGYLVIFDRWDALAMGDAASWAKTRTILVDASRYWHARSVPFVVLLTGEGPEVDLP